LMWFLVGIFLFPGFFQLAELEPNLRSDDFLSVSCHDGAQCFLIDGAGNLLFSSDAGESITCRARLQKIGLRKIRFLGLIDGWGLDRKGGLWRSRNGGARFSSVAIPGQALVVDIELSGEDLWMVTSDRYLYRVDPRGQIFLQSRVPSRPAALAVHSGKQIAVLGKVKGDLSISTNGGQSWITSRPLEGAASDVAFGDSGQIVVSGCKNELAFSKDGGNKFTPLKLGEVEPETGTKCVRVAGFLHDGRVALMGSSGVVLVVDPGSDKVEKFQSRFGKDWSDAGNTREGILLAGASGSMARLKTQSGGQPTLIDLGQERPGIVDIDAPAPGVFWVANGNGKLTVTTDNGTKWSQSTPPAAGPSRFSWVDARHGFALAGMHEVFGTGDGGRTWKKMGLWPDVGLRDIFFLDRRRGWLVGDHGCVVWTMDGGTTWTLDRLEDDRTLRRVLFVDGRRGWAIGDQQSVYYSADGGRTWSSRLSGQGNLRALDFKRSGKGWIGGDSGVLLYSEDGGESWEPRPVPTDTTITDITFMDDLRGLAAGERGEAFLTKDGGKSWHLLRLHTLSDFTVVSCHPKTNRCMLGSRRGQLFRGAPFRYFP
jgi:photosystem II stability/assembly factor-like uncharacterized protein